MGRQHSTMSGEERRSKDIPLGVERSKEIRFYMVQNDGEIKGRYSRLLLAHSIKVILGTQIKV